jgi:hypothetical protein
VSASPTVFRHSIFVSQRRESPQSQNSAESWIGVVSSAGQERVGEAGGISGHVSCAGQNIAAGESRSPEGLGCLEVGRCVSGEVKRLKDSPPRSGPSVSEVDWRAGWGAAQKELKDWVIEELSD